MIANGDIVVNATIKVFKEVTRTSTNDFDIINQNKYVIGMPFCY